jgi:hypothetical protein
MPPGGMPGGGGPPPQAPGPEIEEIDWF